LAKKGTGEQARRENTCDFRDLEECAISPVPFKGRMSRARASLGMRAKKSLKSETWWRADSHTKPRAPIHSSGCSLDSLADHPSAKHESAIRKVPSTPSNNGVTMVSASGTRAMLITAIVSNGQCVIGHGLAATELATFDAESLWSSADCWSCIPFFWS
jgi:hypothetical protein